MSVIELPFPFKRAKCFFCNKPLMKKGKFVEGFSLCTTLGVAVLTCAEDAEQGDKMIAGLNMFKLQKSVTLRKGLHVGGSHAN